MDTYELYDGELTAAALLPPRVGVPGVRTLPVRLTLMLLPPPPLGSSMGMVLNEAGGERLVLATFSTVVAAAAATTRGWMDKMVSRSLRVSCARACVDVCVCVVRICVCVCVRIQIDSYSYTGIRPDRQTSVPASAT
ncbi:hypothetical protein Vretimale_6716 [Volvox reticuliferus]|uniref:Uncharacterized protein n=1 Tax=Volvox reticuliferus TaxID=1737510 RepID=A0A8J4G8E6_9CHLO|nr:hypothetical protein Vretimale_6716 [Volvox reticuliferus]